MAITTEHRIYISLAVLAALSAGVYASNKSEKKEQERLTSGVGSANVPEMKLPADEVDKITKLEIKNADKSDVVLEKKGDEWRVTKPVEYRANQENVKSAIGSLKELKGKELIDPSTASYPEYDLTDAKAVHVMAWADTTKAYDAYFGKSGGRGQMARKEGADGVYALSGYSAYQFTREVKAWRDLEIAKLDDNAITRVDIKNASGDYVFKKDEKAAAAGAGGAEGANSSSWTGTLKGQKIDRFDDAKVKDMLRAYKALNAEDFADNKPDTETGLDTPEATMVFTPKDGAPTKILVGKTATGESHYLRKDGNPQSFIVASWASGWAVAKPEKFQRPDEKKEGAGGAGSGKAAAAGSASGKTADAKKKLATLVLGPSLLS